MPEAQTIAAQQACMEPLQLAGLMIMENGGEIYRVEETVTRMGTAFGLSEIESFAVPSGLFISYRLSDGSTASSVKRVRRGSTNLTRVDEVNSVSREIEAGTLTMAQACERLRQIRDQRFPTALLPLAAGVCAGGFSLMFGGGIVEALSACLLGALVQAIAPLMARFHMHDMATILLSSLLTTLLPMIAQKLWPALLGEAVIAGALMPLLPGLAMTNAVQDTLRGDMVAGTSHGLQAILTAGLIAGGALVSAALFRTLFGG